MTNYSELKGLAEAATPGPWGYDGSYVCPTRNEDGTTYVESWRSVADCHQPENTKFIAAANPAAVLALIAENENARRTGSFWKDEKICADAVIVQLKAENEALRNGLHDIAKKASESRSLTRRLTWIEGRAESALLGKPWASHVFMMPDPKNGKPKAERLEVENKNLKAEVYELRKQIDDMSPLKGAPLIGPDLKCLACGGDHYGISGLPCQKMAQMAQGAKDD